MESATSTLSSKPENDDDEPQAKNPKPSKENHQRRADDDADVRLLARGAPEHRKCTFPGCEKYRFKNRMCRYHNKPETAATTGKKGGRRLCVVPGCEKNSRGRNSNYMCRNHFKLWSQENNSG